MMRSFTVLLLSLMLGLASVSMAVARAEMRGAETITLCSGSKSISIAVDTRGNPVKGVHLCPDCVAGMAFALWPDPPQCLGPSLRGQRLAHPCPALSASLSPLAPQARGPPLLA